MRTTPPPVRILEDLEGRSSHHPLLYVMLAWHWVFRYCPRVYRTASINCHVRKYPSTPPSEASGGIHTHYLGLMYLADFDLRVNICRNSQRNTVRSVVDDRAGANVLWREVRVMCPVDWSSKTGRGCPKSNCVRCPWPREMRQQIRKQEVQLSTVSEHE